MTAKSQTIAIIDDDPLVLATLCDLLRENGFEPHAFSDSQSLVATKPIVYDLYLIDLRLANESGLDIARDVVLHQQAPVIMLSGFGDEIDKAIGLEAGADDYISKPFNPRELIARVRALLRRYHATQNLAPTSNSSENDSLIRFGEFTMDSSKRLLYDKRGEEVSLTNAEFRLLEYLIAHHDRIIDRAELLNYLGSDLSQYVDRTIDVMILRLRGKIEVSPSKPIHLQTRRGKGYVFVLAPQMLNKD